MRRGLRASAILSVFIATICAFSTTAGALNRLADNSDPTTISITAEFTWNGTRNCDTPRANSVICIAAQAKVDGLGLVEYARDAVPTGETTPDGCPEYSTQGTLWVPGGTAKFDGVPVPTCGADDNPDAHYEYTLRDGAGVLAGATGTGDVVADNGVDRWHGTITLAATNTATNTATSTATNTATNTATSTAKAAATTTTNRGGSSSGPIVGGVVGVVVVAIVAAALVWRRRSRQPAKTA